jgi:hypothetical protein
MGLVLFVMPSLLLGQSREAAKAKIIVEVNKPEHKISRMLFGIFFEDINLCTDGGIYLEPVRNRSFEDADSFQYWKFESTDGRNSAIIFDANVPSRPPMPPLNSFNSKSLCIKASGSFKLENDGYWGMNIVQGNRYTQVGCSSGGLS